MRSSIFIRILYVIIYYVPLFVILKIDWAGSGYEQQMAIYVIILLILPIFDIKEIIFSLKTRKEKQYLMENGEKLTIKIEEIRRNRRLYVYYKGEWVNPDNNKKYKFRSEEYICNRKLKIPNKVDVYIDQFNPKKYYMALKEKVVIKKDKEIKKEKFKEYKLELSCGMLVKNIKQEDIKKLVENRLGFALEKSKKSYLKIFACEEYYLLVLKQRQGMYKYKINDINEVQKIVDNYYRKEEIEDLSNWTYGHEIEVTENIKEEQCFLENIKIEGNYLIFKCDDEDNERTMNISNIIKIVRIVDLSYFSDINTIIYTKESRILFTYSDVVEENKEFDLLQIYKTILNKNENLKDIGIEGNVAVM